MVVYSTTPILFANTYEFVNEACRLYSVIEGIENNISQRSDTLQNETWLVYE